ncbi:hypothetical protein M2451_001980 [Dysgonomonas sp. PFB1-18]|nr:hypothetical protein [Dysgonomonas sp. PF1-14]MDH6339058.1 hypothetical protein [Dysgonomonas sp. PF1-16]MDH6380656.1 hypothetical protein [Dysgonomonas sp. PFB1-18]MDH6398152.1 hypothetical protein [Dysgonomonas sp. PF1-23]
MVNRPNIKYMKIDIVLIQFIIMLRVKIAQSGLYQFLMRKIHTK